MLKNPVFVTRSSVPKVSEFIPYLEEIFQSHQITNNGRFHHQFETELTKYLGIKHVSIYANGTLALIGAIKALELKGEIITTPFSFVATSHAIKFCGLQPVFADIEKERLGLDPEAVEKAITGNTTAIMPVHVYGIPCLMDEIEDIAKEHNLKVIYDAAHAFGVQIDGRSILSKGDLSVLSFHATKLFSTIEGGAVICPDAPIKEKLDLFKNFGIVSETEVIDVGINAKLNEVQAAFGLIQLKHVQNYITKRKQIVELYRENLCDVPGITTIVDLPGVSNNYNYFPILVDEKQYKKSRDDLYAMLKQGNIYSRRYFYPLISNLPSYKDMPSADLSNLKVANDISKKVLCLPLYPELEHEQVLKIAKMIKEVCLLK